MIWNCSLKLHEKAPPWIYCRTCYLIQFESHRLMPLPDERHAIWHCRLWLRVGWHMPRHTISYGGTRWPTGRAPGVQHLNICFWIVTALTYRRGGGGVQEGRSRDRSHKGNCKEGDNSEGGPFVDLAHDPRTTRRYPLVVSSSGFSRPRHSAASVVAACVVTLHHSWPIMGS